MLMVMLVVVLETLTVPGMAASLDQSMSRISVSVSTFIT